MRPMRIVLGWQVIATAVLTLAFGFVWGVHGALSASLGGAVNVIAGAAYALMASRSKPRSAGEALRGVLRAEATKIILILVLLTVALSYYREIVHGAFFTSFVVTVVIFATAIAVREDEENKATRTAGER
jgi:ATP synthase protein I